MRSDACALGGKACPERSMDPGGNDVERENGQHGQEPLDEALPALPLGGSGRALDAVQKLGGGDGGDADWLFAVRDQGAREIDGAPFGGDQNR